MYNKLYLHICKGIHQIPNAVLRSQGIKREAFLTNGKNIRMLSSCVCVYADMTFLHRIHSKKLATDKYLFKQYNLIIKFI